MIETGELRVIVNVTIKVRIAPTTRQRMVFAKERNLVSCNGNPGSFKDNIWAPYLVTYLYTV